MKKLLMFCIMTMFAVCVSDMRAMAAGAQVGDKCTLDGDELVDGGKKPVSCNEHSLDNARTCVAYCHNGKIIFGIESCMNKFFKLDRYEENHDLFKRCGDERAACLSDQSVASGAEWNDAMLSAKCICIDNRQEWNKEQMICLDKADYTACQRHKDASWDQHAGACVCNNSSRFRWDNVQHECVEYMDKAQCDKYMAMPDAQFDGRVQWNKITGHCDCIEDKDGNKITKPDDWQIGKLGCEKKKSTERGEAFDANKPAAELAKKEISKITDELDGISDVWGRSHWKNASGGFNTARLASDSIAGVVLGTVGGVVTSNIIKKNQVKGGFEDINCSIGGQRVADYDDQFQVGIGFGGQ